VTTTSRFGFVHPHSAIGFKLIANHRTSMVCLRLCPVLLADRTVRQNDITIVERSKTSQRQINFYILINQDKSLTLIHRLNALVSGVIRLFRKTLLVYSQ